jgi:hypothetical protein
MTSPPPRRNRRADMKDAIDAVRANCAGCSRDEVEQLLRTELAARGLDSPEPLIGAAADVLAHPRSPRALTGYARMMRFGLRTLAEMVSSSDALSDFLTDHGVGAIKDPADQTSAWVDVLLDDDGKGVLRLRRERLSLPAGARDQVAVRLQRVETGTTGGVVAAYVDELRVGTLTRKDSVRYLPAVAAGRERGERGLLTLGLSTVERDAQPRLRIAPAEQA